MILVTQLFAYVVMVDHGLDDLASPTFFLKSPRSSCHEMPFVISDMFSADYNQTSNQTSNPSPFDDVTCDLDTLHGAIPLFLLCFVCVVLLISELARDCLGSCDLFCDAKKRDPYVPCVSRLWTRFFSFFIFAETILACCAGLLFAVLGISEGNSADAIMNCVAVLFLHEIDEKMFLLWARFGDVRKARKARRQRENRTREIGPWSQQFWFSQSAQNAKPDGDDDDESSSAKWTWSVKNATGCYFMSLVFFMAAIMMPILWESVDHDKSVW